MTLSYIQVNEIVKLVQSASDEQVCKIRELCESEQHKRLAARNTPRIVKEMTFAGGGK